MVISSQPLPAKVWQRIKDPHVDMLTLDNTVYRIQRIPELGSGIVTWSSTLPLQQRIRQQLFFWLPAGIFTSLLATAAAASAKAPALTAQQYAGRPQFRSDSGSLSADYFVAGRENCRGGGPGPLAAARWHFLSPDIFIPRRADRAHHAADGRYRQENFCRSGPWLRQRPEVHISINLSVDDLRSPTLPTLLHNQLQHWGSPPNRSSLKSPSAVLSTRRRLCR